MKIIHRPTIALRVVSAVLTLLVALIGLPAFEARGASPGTNGKIAFSRQPLGGDREIFLMNGDGTNPTNVTNNAAADDQPGFSPNGSKIAFSSNRDGNSEIWVMNANGSSPVQLTTTDAPVFNVNPAWSPDGAHIAFQTNRDAGDNEIYVMTASGASPINVTNSAGADASPSWSPDGTKIAFRSARNSGNNEIYVMDAEGSNQTRTTNTANGEFHPDWSPDGTRIVYSKDGGSGGSRDIWVMDAVGTNQTAYTDSTDAEDYPVFSPDGTKIAYHRLVGSGNGEIYVMDADGTDEAPVTSLDHADFEPSWGPVPPRYRPDGRIKKTAETSYVGNNIYNTTSLNQTESASKKRRQAQVFTIQVQNDGNIVDSFGLKGCGDSGAFDLTYYLGMSGTTNISSGVISGTYSMNNVAPGASRSLRMKVFVKPGASIGAAKSCLLTAKSKSQTTRKDAVKAKVTVARG